MKYSTENVTIYNKPHGPGAEAVLYDGFIYQSHHRSHHESFLEFMEAVFPEVKNHNDIYNMCLPGGDLEKKVMHGWYSPTYNTFCWDHFVGD
jgi:hypothetical protein